MSRSIECTKIIEHGDLHSHLNFEFEVEEGTNQINVQINNIDYPNIKVNLMLYGPNGYRGMMDKDKMHFMIGDAQASYGFIPGKIEEGRWRLVADIAKLGAPTQLLITIDCREIPFQWYQGDMHTHTIHSDGLHNITEAAYIAKNEGLDFIALTDHNTFTQNMAMPMIEDFTFIAGMELTTGQGHTNFLGLVKPLDGFKYSCKEEVQAMMEEASTKGAYISVNHPFTGDRWLWGFEDLPYNAVELWNGTPLSRNLKIIEWWQEQLVHGSKMSITGGSDVHQQGSDRRCYGQGRTLIYAETLCEKALIEALFLGHNAVAASGSSSFAEIFIMNKMMGDTIIIEANRGQLLLEIKMQLAKQSLLKVYTADDCVYEHDYDAVDSVNIEVALPLSSRFARVEIWQYDENGALYNPFFTNPIYIQEQIYDEV